jgi:hypothetical protein
MTGSWKTTTASILSALMVTLSTLVAFQTPAALLTPGASRILLYITTGATLLASLCRVWVGLLQNDAPPPASIAPITVTVPVPVTVIHAPTALAALPVGQQISPKVGQ